MKSLFARFVKDESGATAIEYGLIAGLVSVVIAGTLLSVGGTLKTTFSNINSELAAANSGGGGGTTP